MTEATALRKIVEHGRFLGYGVPGEFLIRPRMGVQVVEDWPWRPKPKPEPARKAASAYNDKPIFCLHCSLWKKLARPGDACDHLWSNGGSIGTKSTTPRVEIDFYGEVRCANCSNTFRATDIYGVSRIANTPAKCDQCGMSHIAYRP